MRNLFCLIALVAAFATGHAYATNNTPLNIGVMAVGPRTLPTATCGSFVAPGTTSSPLYYAPGLQDGLTQLGYTNVKLDIQQGDVPTLKTVAQNFVNSHYDMIVAVSTSAVDIAKAATSVVPILFPDISDPVGSGYAQTLLAPGYNLTGLSPQLTQSTGQRLTYFQQIVGPALKTVMVIYNPTFAPSQASVPLLRTAASALKITLLEKTITTATSRADVQAIMQNLKAGDADGFFFLNDTYVIANADLIFNQASTLNMPVMGVHSYMAEWGAIASYPSDPYGDGIKLASFVDQIANGKSPATIPIIQQAPVFVINLKRAGCLQITVDPNLVSQANQVLR